MLLLFHFGLPPDGLPLPWAPSLLGIDFRPKRSPNTFRREL